MRTISKRALLVLFVALLLLGVGLFLGKDRLPDGLIPAAGTYDVRILRDTWGVPHIFGRTDADVAYGLAYAHAEDDFETLQGVLLAARGKLASHFGRDAAPNDYMVHLLRIPDVVAEGYPQLSPKVRALCEAYADGLNHYAALHPDDAIARLYPVRGEDLVAGFVHKVPLFFGIDKALQQIFESDEPPVVARAARFGLAPRGPSTYGSNTFAVGPSRTADGGTYLLINSHQPWDGPVAWYEAHLRSEQGWDAVGGVFPGAPVILHGHNRHLGWAHTVNKPDLLDLYALEMDPDDAERYRFDEGWQRLETRQAPIEVKLFGPLRWTFTRDVAWSQHGPAMQRPHGTYALRFAGLGEVGHIEQWYRMNKASTFDEWRAAMRRLALPMFNTAYADHEGNIFYVYNAKLPRRDPAFDWSGYLPGDTSRTVWEDSLTFDELPQVLNPSSGFLQNCNNSPFRTTAEGENPLVENFPASLGIEQRMTNRGLRALELLGGDPSISLEELDAYKYDTYYAADSEMGHLVRRALALPAPEDEELHEALAVLAAWDLGTRVDNRQAGLALLAFHPFLSITEPVEPPTDDELLPALKSAAGTLRRDFGAVEVPWGEISRLRRGSTDLPLGGGPDTLRAIYSEPEDDGRYAAIAGDSYVLRVAWGVDGEMRSHSIHQYGSATRDTSSPHYADQSPLFARREMKPVWMEESEIRANLSREYRPGEPSGRDRR